MYQLEQFIFVIGREKSIQPYWGIDGKHVLHFPTIGGHNIQPFWGIDGKHVLHFPTILQVGTISNPTWEQMQNTCYLGQQLDSLHPQVGTISNPTVKKMEKSVTFSNFWIPYSHRWAPYPTLLGSRWKHLLHFPTEGKNLLHFPTAKNLTATGGHHIQPY